MNFRMMQILFFLAVIVLQSIWGSATDIVKGPYLIFPGDNTRMTVLYQLDSTAACTLEWGTDTGYSDGSVQTREYGSDHQHKYVISNLIPATKYYYRVNVGGTYYTGTFFSAPAAEAQDVKFLVYGDTRTHPADHDSVCARMIDTYTADPGYQTFTGHAGDWVSNGNLEGDWTYEFFNRSEPNMIAMQANLPIMGCMGNHEYSGLLYRKYWPYNFQAGGRYFSFDYGPAHVVVLDQYVDYTPGSAQYTWLESDLAATGKPWKFLIFHEPGWSAGGHFNNMTVQEYIHPLCLQYRIKVVFAGHNHYYARCLVDGIHHVTSGGGGAPLNTPNPEALNMVAAAQAYHFCEVDIQGDQLNFVARDRSGNVIDIFTTDNTIPPALPWSDGFESGDLTAGGWISSGKVSVYTSAYSGSYAARTNAGASLIKSVNTLGFSKIHVKYARKTSGLDADEYLVVEWYDGSAWNEIERTPDTSWSHVDHLLPAAADENAWFKLRFHASGADNNEYIFIDQVVISGVSNVPDTTHPLPDPMTWDILPHTTGTSSISMTATTATDTSGVEYYFECTAGSGHDSGWQDIPTYEDTGLAPDTRYNYRVKARDKSPNLNETALSTDASATTQAGVEIYVNTIVMDFRTAGANYFGQAFVWIRDTTGDNIEGATVLGNWSGSVSGPVQGSTGPDGTVILESPKNKGGGRFTFTVTDVVTPVNPYNPGLNIKTSDTITI